MDNQVANAVEGVLDKMYPDRPKSMGFLDEEHKRLITLCHDKGHQWQEWEDMKFVSGSERVCKRCKLHVSLYTDKKVQSYAVGSVWPSHDAAIPFINSLAYRSNEDVRKGVVR